MRVSIPPDTQAAVNFMVLVEDGVGSVRVQAFDLVAAVAALALRECRPLFRGVQEAAGCVPRDVEAEIEYAAEKKYRDLLTKALTPLLSWSVK